MIQKNKFKIIALLSVGLLIQAGIVALAVHLGPSFLTVLRANVHGAGSLPSWPSASSAAWHFSNLHNFAAYPAGQFTNSDGANPQGGLVLSGNTLYGTAGDGGTNGSGMIFSVALPTPKLTINFSGGNVVIAYPTNLLNFTLQSTTNLDPVWSPVPLSPVIINGQNVVTNPISGAPQPFFRLGL